MGFFDFLSKKKPKEHFTEVQKSDNPFEVGTNLYNAGNDCIRQGKFQDAIGWYDAALKDSPGLKEAWYNKGLALSELGRFTEAIECYDKVLAIDPNNANAWEYRADSLDKQGRHEEATYSLAKAFDIQKKIVEDQITRKI